MMAQQRIELQPALTTDVPDGCIALVEIEYLLDTGRIDHVTLAGVPMVSLDGIRDYLARQTYSDELQSLEQLPSPFKLHHAGSLSASAEYDLTGESHE